MGAAVPRAGVTMFGIGGNKEKGFVMRLGTADQYRCQDPSGVCSANTVTKRPADSRLIQSYRAMC